LSGRYLIERLIGEGGMGAVYQAEHTHMRKRLAVKVLHPEMSRMSEVVARFEREAMAAAHIEHPNVAAATDFGKLDDGSFFLVLEYVEGKSLRDAQHDGRLELGRALHITRQIASALSRAHALGIVHRDLKPENVMLVTRDTDTDFVKVLDFGIAKVPVGALGGGDGAGKPPGQALTQLGMVYGTPEYMAPEQALGQDVDLRADLYALGVMMFEMITGKRPYEHESKVTLLGMHVTAPIPSMAERAPDANVPPEVDAIVARLLSKEATARFADAKELVDAIDAATSALAARGRIAEPLPPMSMGFGPPRPSLASASGPRSALALGPTGLAQPVSVPGSLLRSPFGALAGIGARLPVWMTPRVLVLAGGASLILLLVIIVATTGSHAGDGRATSASANASGVESAAPVPPPDPAVDDVVAAAQAKIDKGDFATAIDELTAVELRVPQRADIHALLERAYTGARNGPGAMLEAGLWLAADPSAAADLKLQEDVRNAALLHDAQDDAFKLLEKGMGMRGIDILYDIAFGNSGKLYPQAAGRARQSLLSSDIHARASPALKVLLDIKDAKTCDAKHDLLAEANKSADARILPILQSYTYVRGCGFLSRSDCWPCMHHDTALQTAITAINDRAKGQ
jgi:serine/threonine-protein kinase